MPLLLGNIRVRGHFFVSIYTVMEYKGIKIAKIYLVELCKTSIFQRFQGIKFVPNMEEE